MSGFLIAVLGTVAAGALTWFFCMRPMLKSKSGDGGDACCAAPTRSIQDEIQAARKDLQQLSAARSAGALQIPRGE